MTFLVFHLDISGKDIKDEHPSNIPFILVKDELFKWYLSNLKENEGNNSNKVVWHEKTVLYSVIAFSSRQSVLD